MHIAFWSPALPGGSAPNGIVTYVGIMCAALERAGHQVSILTSKGIRLCSGEIVEIDPAPSIIERMKRKLRGEDLVAQGARTISNRFSVADAHQKIDILEIEESFGWIEHLAEKLPCAIVVRLHGPHLFGRDIVETVAIRMKSERRIVAEGRGLAAAHALSSPSPKLLADVTRHYGLKSSVAEVIQNPVPTAPEGRRWNFAECDGNQILNIGRFDLRKGADLILNAFHHALKRKPTLTLVMVGPDRGIAQADGTLVHFDDFVSRNLPAATRSKIRHLGTKSHAEIAELRRSSALSVVGARFETFSYVVAEGMALGMPTVVADTYGLSELLARGSEQVVTPSGDIPALAEAMVTLTDSPSRLVLMGTEAYGICQDQLSPDHIIEHAVRLYSRALTSMSGNVSS